MKILMLATLLMLPSVGQARDGDDDVLRRGGGGGGQGQQRLRNQIANAAEDLVDASKELRQALKSERSARSAAKLAGDLRKEAKGLSKIADLAPKPALKQQHNQIKGLVGRLGHAVSQLSGPIIVGGGRGGSGAIGGRGGSGAIGGRGGRGGPGGPGGRGLGGGGLGGGNFAAQIAFGTVLDLTAELGDLIADLQTSRPPRPLPPPQRGGHWVSTNGGNCQNVCADYGLFSGESREGAQCASGEVRPRSLKGAVPFIHGCWPNCAPDATTAAYSNGRYCYRPGQKRDNDRTDITIGCFCER